MHKVLIVDDEVEIVDFLSNFLRRFKIISEKAHNGKEAIETYSKAKPDWVFLDIKMPEMDGFEVLKELQKTESDAKVIMITGREDRESQSKAKKLGAVDYIVKPIDLEDLHQKIKTHILGG